MKNKLICLLVLVTTLCGWCDDLITSLPLEKHERQFEKTMMFMRAHLKYNNATNYLRQYPDGWIDRPLFNHPYDVPKSDMPFGGREAFLDDLKECLDYGADGFAALVITVSPSYVTRLEHELEYIKGQPKGKILPEVTIFKATFNDPSLTLAVKDGASNTSVFIDRMFKASLASPYTYRHKGKVVISSYMADSVKPEDWKAMLAQWRKQYGDTFWFVPEVRMPLYNPRVNYSSKGGLTQVEIDKMKASLRSYLDVADGIHFAACNHLATAPENRYYNLKYFRDIVIPVMVSVLNEPAYRGKILGLGIAKGYINHISHSNVLEEGTGYLRGTYEAVMAANPDYIIGVEWNEFNENTNIQTTVCDGMSSRHIFRNYAGLPNTADATVPNLICSIPWARGYGEKLHIELLNLPEKDFNGAYTATVALANTDGKTVWTSKALSFDSGKRHAVQLTIPSEQLAPSFLLHPVVTLALPGGKRVVISDGLGAIRLTASSNICYKDVKTPIRDLLKLKKCSAVASNHGGKNIVNVEVESEKPLRSVELVKNHSVVWAASAALPEKVFRYQFSYNGWKSLNKSVPFIRIAVRNGKLSAVEEYLRMWNTVNYRLVKDNAMVIPSPAISYGTRQGLAFTVTPTKSEDECSIVLELGKEHSYVFSLKELEYPGQNVTELGQGGEFRLTRVTMPINTLPELKCNSVKTQASLPLVSPGDLLELRIIGMGGEIFRHKPIIIPGATNGKPLAISVPSESAGKAVSISVPPAARPVIRYNFNAGKGGYLPTENPAYADFNGILGGSCGISQPFFNSQNHPRPAAGGCPAWRSEYGAGYLHFDGAGDYLVIPAIAVPFRDFEFSMRIRPEENGRQILISYLGKGYGTLAQAYLEKGCVHLNFYDNKERHYQECSQPGINYGQWNTVVIRCRGDLLTIIINGKERLKKAFPGFIGTHASPLVFGGSWRKECKFFKGDLQILTIW